MIFDHLLMLFKAPLKSGSDIEEKQYTFYGRDKPAELEAYSLEISPGLAKRLVSAKDRPAGATEPELGAVYILSEIFRKPGFALIKLKIFIYIGRTC